ncbi:PEP-CTERM-box response regulator transcription factor [Pararhodospirillum oryzae]|uniref:PEP-CTERM-box response regulator transcription factor n=1 Tax=Pararhodospirillum oryzae TaxID=478448 RepID=A0A512H3X6_9PROT|nr:PEP-CTERM-box response regulator transcription factor [Pararhodospirillum oryzae]GEO80133.1 PEP-CTERM-box response regulator transcription factor [Pararhodospirillum oryzae]
MASEPSDLPRILIVDDERSLRVQLKWALSAYPVLLAGDRGSALELFERERPPIVILDLGLPPDCDNATEGLAILREIQARQPLTRVIVASGNQDRRNALMAIGLGACDYYAKPIDAAVLGVMVERAWNYYKLQSDLQALPSGADDAPVASTAAGLVASSPAMHKVCSLARQAAASTVSVLLTGESGSGKDMLAKAIHGWSPRAEGPFIAINCAAIPDALLESELFGHEKGAFTGAVGRVIGKVEQAHAGTLFLDEIGDMPLALQAKLLRFLQEKTIDRVGGRRPIAVDVRVVAATNKNLEAMRNDGRFREDLFFRLNEFDIALPPLRERPEDIVPIARHLLTKHRHTVATPPQAFSPTALDRMQAYAWPGNVREMENRIKRGIVVGQGVITAEDLGLASFPVDGALETGAAPMDQGDDLPTLRAAREDAERHLINRTLAMTDNNIQKAARILGVSRPTLYSLIKSLGIPRGDE